MKMKQKEYIKTGLTCMALLMFATVFTIATAEQVQSVQPTQPGLLPGQFVTPDGRYIMNESDFAKAVISSGTITVPITDDINERHNISRNTIIALNKKFNVPDNETVTLGCDFKKGSCTYEIKKPVKGTVTAWSAVSPTSPPSSFGGWAESANYFATSGTTSFHGHWKVPKAPSSKVGQLLYYFIALQPDGIGIIQPVLEWNKFHPYENLWAIDSWYEDINGNYVNGTPIRTNVGDSIAGYLEYEIYQGNPIQWWIFTDDITTGTESINHLLDGRTWYQNYVAFEPYGVNSCSTYPGGADFTGLGINNAAAPSWLPWINSSAQAICPSLGVNIVSPYEVQLKAFPNDTVGVYTPSTGTFYLKNSDTGGAADISVQDGTTGDTPIVGDWDGK